MNTVAAREQVVHISAGAHALEGFLLIPPGAQGLVLFVHGSGSSRHSRRNQAVARALVDGGLGVLLFDLLTAEEERIDLQTHHLRFDIGLLAKRVVAATDWLTRQPQAQHLAIGYFGASTGAAAALIAAAERPKHARAVVSRGGRPDLAQAHLAAVQAPTLLIVGGDDTPVIGLNQQAYAGLQGVKEMVIVPGASHLFEEPGALEEVSRLASAWFRRYLKRHEPEERTA
jgi:putative phosphoribosyl transferase